MLEDRAARLKTKSEFYWKSRYWGTGFDYTVDLPLGTAVILANRMSCVVGTSRATAEAMNYADDESFWQVVDGVPESGSEQVVAFDWAPDHESDLAQFQSSLPALRRQLTHLTERNRKRKRANRVSGEVYRWARENLDPAQAWVRRLALQVIEDVLAKDPTVITISSSPLRRMLTSHVDILGFPCRVSIGEYSPTEKKLIVYAPEFEAPCSRVLAHRGVEFTGLALHDRSNPHDHIFGWPVYERLGFERARSLRILPQRVAEQLPEPIVQTIRESWSTYDRLGLPAVVKKRLSLLTGNIIDQHQHTCLMCSPAPASQTTGMCSACETDQLGLPEHGDRQWIPSMHWGMQQLELEFGGAMTSLQTRPLIPYSEPNAVIRIAARMTAHQGESAWTEKLIDAGVAADGHRASRGLVSKAQDGHLCRSLLERVIDDFMNAHGVAHECEPHYPEDYRLNPGRRFRADWELADGTFVEAWGALSDPRYANRAGRKRRLAAQHGLLLLEITPNDVRRLPDLLRPWFDTRTSD